VTSTVVTTTKSTERAVTLAEQVRSGNVRAVSRLITLLERQDPDGIEGLRLLSPDTRPRIVIGVTGYPGAGKSTLINALLCAYRRQESKVAVLAVDVSSAMTGGALLGDRIRMQEHALDSGVYIRSMATRGNHGGLARTTDAAKLVLEAAGYDVVLIETVGVGQNEADIMNISPTVLAVVAPGLGDEVQAMKAGLLELAHIIVVNKADHPDADRTVRDLREWCPTVIATVATTGEGLSELLAAIAAHQRTRGMANAHQRFE
jgi:GTPase